jgi:hypothetical protein
METAAIDKRDRHFAIEDPAVLVRRKIIVADHEERYTAGTRASHGVNRLST